MQNSFAVLRTISRPGKSHCDEDRAEGQSAAADATEHQRNLKRIRIDNQLIVGQGFDSTSLDDQQNSCLLYLRAGQVSVYTLPEQINYICRTCGSIFTSKVAFCYVFLWDR